MQSLRKLLAVSTAIVALGVLAPAASAGSQKPFHLEKVCDVAAGRCVVTASTFAPIPAGTEINYSGLDPDHLTAVLTIKNGTATGQCAIGSVFAQPIDSWKLRVRVGHRAVDPVPPRRGGDPRRRGSGSGTAGTPSATDPRVQVQRTAELSAARRQGDEMHVQIVTFSLRDLSDAAIVAMRGTRECLHRLARTRLEGLAGRQGDEHIRMDLQLGGSTRPWRHTSRSDIFTAIAANPDLVGITSRDFEVLEGPTRVTQAPGSAAA